MIFAMTGNPPLVFPVSGLSNFYMLIGVVDEVGALHFSMLSMLCYSSDFLG